MRNSCTSVFPNTFAWEQRERNKIKRQTKKVRRDARVYKEAKQARKKRNPDCLSHPNQNVLLINKIL